MIREDLRNVAIIAHVDHGKTTLVDAMLKQSHTFRDNQAVEERVMDSNDLERERGITILAKNTSIRYKGVKINVVDTPGHADFSGEVERVMMMVNGVLVLVDAAEGPMPQTRFVVQKALEMGHRLIIVVNKIDRPDARLNEVQDEILELLLELDASDDQLMSPVVWCSGRDGTATLDLNEKGKDLTPLFETILSHIKPMEVDDKGAAQLLVSSIDYNDYVGRIGIGRIERGEVKQGQAVTVTNYNDVHLRNPGKIVNLYQIEGLQRTPCESAKAGDIVCFSGLEKINIGDTVCSPTGGAALRVVPVPEPPGAMAGSV
ncbi:MAG: GTP-binding protein, partial [Clostridia bacterium]|nr:GTP-binding protein [Clostridia bacterium]